MAAGNPSRIRSDVASALRRRLAYAAAVVAALGVGVYAGAQVGGSSATGTVATSSTNAPLSARVLAPGALPGFSLNADSAPVASAYDWALVERSRTPERETARLRSLGFQGGFDEQLHAPYPSQAAAASIVERYRTASAARGELAYQYTQLRRQAGGSGSTFAVPTIPGARAIRTQAGGHVDTSVLFSFGSYFYVIRTGSPVHTQGALNQAQLATAAGTLYLTASGCVVAKQTA